MPDFSRQKPIFASSIWGCLFLLAFPQTAIRAAHVVSGTVRTADIPIVYVPQNSGELHTLAEGFTATAAPKRTPLRDILAAVKEKESESGQIQLVSGNSPNPLRITAETVKPPGSSSLSFQQQPSRAKAQPLGSIPFREEKQSTRPIPQSTLQKAKPLPIKSNQIATVSGINSADSAFSHAEIDEEQTLEELHFVPITETDSAEDFDESEYERRFAGDLFPESMDLDEPMSFSRRDPYSETQDSVADHSDDSDLLSRALPERKEKGEGKLTFMPVGSQLMPLLSVLGSLCLVLGAFFMFVLFMKKVGPKTGGNLPREALENVGRYPLNQKLQLNLIRLGNRLILVAVTPDGGVETISEIESPDEVAQILAQCRKLDPNGSQAQFKTVLDEFAQEKNHGGFFGPNDPKRKTNATPTLSSLLAGGLRGSNQQSGGIYG